MCGCALPQVVPEALSQEYVPTGELQLNRLGATFDHVRVRSPTMNLAKRTDGSWGGTFGDRPIDVSVTDTAIRGVDLIVNRGDSKPGHLVITGQFQGKIFRFEFDQNQALIRTPGNSFTLPGRQVTKDGAAYGPRNDFTLKGEASVENPPWPQIGFALLAAFN